MKTNGITGTVKKGIAVTALLLFHVMLFSSSTGIQKKNTAEWLPGAATTLHLVPVK